MSGIKDWAKGVFVLIGFFFVLCVSAVNAMAAGALTTYADNVWLNHIFGTSYSPVATVYIGLSTASPGKAATGASCSEVANSGSYARKAITFGAAASRGVTQSGAVTFNQASGAWGTVTDWFIADSGTYGAGNVLAYGHFTSSFSPVSGNTPSIASGQVQVQISASSGVGFTTALCNSMLNLIFRNTAYSQPATYVALLNSAPADADTTLTTKECSGTAYARVLVNKVGGASPAWNTIASGALSNNQTISFPTVGSGGWTQIVGMAIADASSSGNELCYDGTNVVTQTPAAGDTVSFAGSALGVSMN